MNKYFLLSRLQPYRNRQILLYNNQSTNDIIHVLLNAHKLYKSDYDKICRFFWKGNAYRTARFLFQFLKNNVPYKIEPDSKQTIKSPAAIISLKGDCKHYASWIGGICDALCRNGKHINWCYRFANYKLFGSVPHHVFCVIKTRDGEIWVDPVLASFNYKKPYVNKIDRKP